MEQSNTLRQDIESFQLAVKKLSDVVNKCGVDWNDKQFLKLSDAIKTVASSSKRVVGSGSACENAIRRFQRIESE